MMKVNNVLIGTAIAAVFFTVAADVADAELKPVVVQPTDKIESELVTLGPFGPEPNTITRKAGPFAICVENRSHSAKFKASVLQGTDTVDKVKGPIQSLLDFDFDESNGRKTFLINPAAGTYTLSVPGKPDLTFTLVIQ